MSIRRRLQLIEREVFVRDPINIIYVDHALDGFPYADSDTVRAELWRQLRVGKFPAKTGDAAFDREARAKAMAHLNDPRALMAFDAGDAAIL